MASSDTLDEVPQTLVDAIRFFSDPDTCHTLACSLVYPDGVTCPHCQHKEQSFIKTRRIWHCKGCKKQFSLKVGTIFEDSALGLDKWLTAIWLIANAKNGISSYEVHRALGVQQRTAWFMLHRIRLAMQTGTFRKMSGQVEVDETFIGGKEKNKHESKKLRQGRGTVGKAIVMGVLERAPEPEKPSQVRTKVMPDTKKSTLQREVWGNVEAGAEVFTDALSSYQGLDARFVHEAVDHAVEYVRGNVHTNGLENFWSLLKRSIKGTYVSVESFHLYRYLDEQAFRFNERKRNDAARFVKTVKAVTGKRLTYKELTGDKSLG